MNRFIILLISFLLFNIDGVTAQTKCLNIPGLLQLVGYSKSEYNLQVTSRNRQAEVSLNEEANKTLLVKLKTVYRDLQQRFHVLGTALMAADVGVQAMPLLQRTVLDQQELVALARQKPVILPMVMGTETEFVARARSLVNYLAGLFLSIGDVNQMQASDRKILFDYVLAELGTLKELSGNLLASVRYSNLKDVVSAANPFRDWVDNDRELATDILRNAKILRQ